MQIIKEDKIIFYDVDDCLVFWPEHLKYNPEDIIEIDSLYPIIGGEQTYKLTPNHNVIEDLKNKSKQEFFIIVWSAAGYEHAEEIVEKLGIIFFVNIVMSKPLYIVDDLKPEEVFTWKHPNELDVQ